MKKWTQAFSAAVLGALVFAGAAAGEARADDCYVQEPLRPVHRTYVRRDVVEPGVYEISRSPSEYGWVHIYNKETGDYLHRRILLRPYKNYSHFQRPYIAFSREHLSIQPEGWRLRRVKARTDCD
jgi:hypothetical protein